MSSRNANLCLFVLQFGQSLSGALNFDHAESLKHFVSFSHEAGVSE